jgi:hypothetical protein
MTGRLMAFAALAVACGGSTDEGLYDGNGGSAGAPLGAVAGATNIGGTSAGGTSAGGTSAGGTSAGGTSAGGTGGNAGKICFIDPDCTPLLCSWKTNTCIAPLPLGEACARDLECQGHLCSWLTELCIVPRESGSECARNAECQSQKCVGFECQ